MFMQAGLPQEYRQAQERAQNKFPVFLFHILCLKDTAVLLFIYLFSKERYAKPAQYSIFFPNLNGQSSNWQIDGPLPTPRFI